MNIFITIILNSPLGIYLVPFQLTLLLWFFSPSFIWNISLSLLIWANSPCFSVLGKSAISPVLESSALMKKRSCHALQYSIPCSPQCGTSERSPMCVACTMPYGWVAFAFSPVIYSDSPYPLRAGFGPCFVTWPVWDHVVLVWSQTRHLPVIQ